MAWGITCALISPIIIAFNIILITAMVKTKETSSFTARYVMCLSVSDIGMGLVAMPLICSMLFVKDLRTNCVYQKIVQCIAYCFGYTSFFMLLAIGVDRYLLIKKLNRYKTLMNSFRWKLIVTTIIVMSITLAIITVSAYSFPLHTTFILTNIFCIGGIYLLYVKLLFRIDQQATTMMGISEQSFVRSKSSTRKSRRRRKEISVARTIRLLLGAIFVLYMPYNITSSVWTYYRFQQNTDPGNALNVSVFWTYVLMFINGIINVLIYGHGNSKIRRFVKSHAHIGHEKSSTLSKDDADSESAKHCDEKKSKLITSTEQSEKEQQ